LTFSLNGGIETLQQVDEHLKAMPGLQGVMVGRAWAADPWGFAMADSLLYHGNDNDNDSRHLQTANTINNSRLQVLKAYGSYADIQEVDEDRRAMESGHYPQGIRRFLVKAVSHLFAGEGNAKRFRVALDDIVNQQTAFIKKTKQRSNANGLLKAATTVTPPGPSFSELLVNIAMEHLSEDVLLETPLQSHERRIAEEQGRQERRRQHSSSLTNRCTMTTQSSSSSTGSTLASNTSDGESQSSGEMSRVEEWQQERRSEKQQHSN
jgi:Dihydrouridine synthase (Dus)